MFKTYPLYTIVLILLAVVQHFLFSKLVLWYASPDLLTLFVAFTSMMLGQRTGTTLGFLSGLLIGFLSGNPGMYALVGTVEGFAAGFFHVPDDSHATSMQKKRMYYAATFTALFSGSLLQVFLSNPLAITLPMRITSLVGLGTLMGMLLAVGFYHLLIRKLLRD